MKKILGIISLGFIALMTFSSHTTNVNSIKVNFQDKKPIHKNVSAKEFKTLIHKNKGVILDVRTEGEVANGAIENSVNLDFYAENFKEELSKLDKNKPYYVYCKSGGRSGNAMKMMKKMGFVEVYNLNGGYSNWPYK